MLHYACTNKVVPSCHKPQSYKGRYTKYSLTLTNSLSVILVLCCLWDDLAVLAVLKFFASILLLRVGFSCFRKVEKTVNFGFKSHCPKLRMNGKKPSKFQFHFPGLLKACSMLKKKDFLNSLTWTLEIIQFIQYPI